MAGKEWSRSELNVLQKFYRENIDADNRLDEMVSALGRNRESVRKQAQRLGLKRHKAVRKSNPYYIINSNGCWIWQGYVGAYGYGIRTIKGFQYLAHRISYQEHKGNIPDGLQIDHLCDNRRCINPEHLEAVSCAENIRRTTSTFLNWKDVLEMRLLAVKFGLTPIEVAVIYSLKISHVHKILKGEIWKCF